jgi:toxin ParE1/3/4
MALRFAAEAELELDHIWGYIATQSGSFDIADRVLDSITERCFLLAAHPFLGRARDDLRPGLRSFATGEYVIIYRVEGQDVLFLHLVHGSRDIQALFRQ